MRWSWGLLLTVVAGSITAAASERGDDASRFRVVTLNVNRASSRSIAESLHRREELRTADVWMLQEIETTESSHGPRELARSLGSEVAYAVARRSPAGTHGIAILSRLPLTDVEVVPLPRFDLGYRSRRRVALSAATRVGDATLRLFNVHLDTRLTFEERWAQAEPVVERAASASRAVLGGDFNTIRSIPFLLPWLPLPLPGFGQARRFDTFMRERGLERSLPVVGSTGPLGMELDALYHVGLDALEHGIVRLPDLSDHAALWVDLRAAEQKETE